MTLKAAFIADWFAPRRGGIENQLLGLAQSLNAAGAEVQVITGMPGPPLIDGISVNRLPCLHLPGLHLAASPNLVGLIRNALTGARPDIVHIHPSIVAPTCLAGFVAARSLGLPVVFTFHSWMINLPRFLRLLDQVWGWTAGPVRITGVSSRIASQLNTIRPDLNARVLPNGFDHAFWSGGSPDPQTGRELTIVTAMRFEPKKRPLVLPVLLKAASTRLQPHGVTVALVAAGHGRLRRATLRRAAQLRVGGQFHIHDWLDREDLRALYQRADIFVLPSITESFGLAALEARAAKLPVVARAGTGIGDYITDGVDGFLCDTDTEMADAVSELCLDRHLLARLSGPRPDLARFDWSRAAAAHLELYRELLQAAGKSAAA